MDTKHENSQQLFFGAKLATNWLALKIAILAAVIALADNSLTPRLLAVEWMENSQPAAQANTNFVTVRLQTVTNELEAYAQVEPISLLPVRAAQSGLVTGLNVVPGDPVKAGQILAELGGPEVEALLVQDEANVNSAQSNLLASQKSLAIQQQQLASHIVTHQMVLQAENAVAQAQAAFDTAQAQLQALRAAVTLKAPSDGTVLVVSATDGERISTGDAVLTIQPMGKLWLRAVYYGADVAAIQTGMAGEFLPAGGGEPIPVRVCTVIGVFTPDGGESVGLLPLKTSNWLDGQSGTVALNGAVQQQVAVPTQALILDQGQWWVLVRTDNGDKPQLVLPGPSRGWQTYMERGLKPGDKVVTEGAYLEFHQGISQNYQPPD